MARKTLKEKFIELLELTEVAPEKQDALIQTRLKGMGFRNPCPRCGGSGLYSTYHGTCYRCGGVGNDPLKLTTDLYNEAVKAVEAGKLKEYFEHIKRQRKLQHASDILFKLMNDNELSRDYSKEYDKEVKSYKENPENHYKINPIIKELRFKQTSLYHEYEKLSTEINNKYFLKDRKGNYKNGTDEDRRNALILLETKSNEIYEQLKTLNESYESMKKMFIESQNID